MRSAIQVLPDFHIARKGYSDSPLHSTANICRNNATDMLDFLIRRTSVREIKVIFG